MILGGSVLTAEAQCFCEAAYDHCWVRPFDWAAWRNTPDGQHLIHDPDAIASASAEDLANVLTMCLRADRFCEGYLADAFAAGLLTRVLVRAEALLASLEASTQ